MFQQLLEGDPFELDSPVQPFLKENRTHQFSIPLAVLTEQFMKSINLNKLYYDI
ncbi:hypothetical protein BpJC4_09630 [Weizmannia acidilactici]|nr:hypothetical protein BpJC4_09630 [Weizmannia acidilactici]